MPKKSLYVAILAFGTMPVKTSYSQIMVFPSERWEEASPESMLVDSDSLTAAVALLQNVGGMGASELIIIRNGRVLWQGPNVDTARETHSVTKSFSSTTLGLAVDEGLVSLDSLAATYLPALAADYPEVTMRHLATLTSGYIALNEPYPDSILDVDYKSDNPLSPGPPMFIPPGSKFAYASTSWDVMTYIVAKLAGQSAQEMFQQRIGDAIGLDPNVWDWGDYLAADGTVVDGGGGWFNQGVVISAQDIARLGHLLVNHGNWDGQQLLSEEWIEAATTVQVPASVPGYVTDDPRTAGNADVPGTYGFGWWIGDQGWYYAGGGGNNYLYVNPTTNFVVARLGEDYQDLPMDAFLRRLTSAVKWLAWDEAGDGQWTDIDARTSSSRWLDDAGERLTMYPAPHSGNAIIRRDNITLDHELAIHQAKVQSGALTLTPTASLRLGDALDVETEGELTVEGTLDASTITVNGTVTVGLNGAVAARKLYVTRAAQPELNTPFIDIQGDVTLDSGDLRRGLINVNSPGNLTASAWTQSGGTLRLEGRTQLGRVTHSGGTLEFSNQAAPMRITENYFSRGTAELRFVLDSDPWSATILFDPDVQVQLGGVLTLAFEDGEGIASLEGTRFDLFDWPAPLAPDNVFSALHTPAGTEWDFSNLYTTGEVILVPEPSAVHLALIGFVGLIGIAHRRVSGVADISNAIRSTF